MRDENIREPQVSPDFPNAFHRVTVKGLYVRDGKVLLSHDFVVPSRPRWELPGGGLDFGEDIKDALKREIQEEMGLEVTSVSDTPMYAWTAKREHARGLDWYYILVLVYKIDIKDLSTITHSDECRDIRFFSKEELLAAPDLDIQVQKLATFFNPQDFT